jgi:hypothetical protein
MTNCLIRVATSPERTAGLMTRTSTPILNAIVARPIAPKEVGDGPYELRLASAAQPKTATSYFATATP